MSRAVGYLQRGAAVEGGNQGRLLNALGVYYSDMGASAEAERTLRAALEVPAGAVDRANTYLNLAREYYYREDWRGAYTLLQTVLELNPGDPVALEKLGEIALRLGERAAAESVAVRLDRSDPDAGRRLRAAMHRLGWQEGS